MEPGFFRTNLHRTMKHNAHWIVDYDDLRPRVESSLTRAFSNGNDPMRVAAAIIAIAASPSPQQHYRIGNDALWVPRLKTFLPDKLFRQGLRMRFDLP